MIAVAMSSCAGRQKKHKLTGETQYIDGTRSAAPRYALQQVDVESWWKGDGVAGAPKVVISLGEQKAYFYKGSEVVGVSSVSTGEENHPTPTGSYRIQQKSPAHRSSQYGDYVDASGNVVAENIESGVDPRPPGSKYRGASMPYFMRFNRGIGMHAGFLPGYPASHGCVRMPDHMAQTFYRNVSIGTPVVVKY